MKPLYKCPHTALAAWAGLAAPTMMTSPAASAAQSADRTNYVFFAPRSQSTSMHCLGVPLQTDPSRVSYLIGNQDHEQGSEDGFR